MGIFFDDRSFEFETRRALTYANAQGASLGEVIEICKNIEVGNFESWYFEWNAMAEKLDRYADNLKLNHRYKSASEFYLRASNYYRTADFFLYRDEPKRILCYNKSVETFRHAMDLMTISYDIVAIPYKDYFMNGYLYFHNEDAPTLLFIGGYDSTVEELYFAGGFSAIERGYNLLIFDGPGQGGVLRKQNKVAEHEFEKPVSAAIDFLHSHTDLKPSNFIGLVGMSLGGYYATRAAAFEKRINACILFDVFTNVWESILAKNPNILSTLSTIEKADSYSRWMLQNGLWVFGAKDIDDLKEKVLPFNALSVAKNIECPMLLQYGTDDIFVTREQLTSLENQLTCDYTEHIFDNSFGGQEHCRAGNISLATQVMFDWFDKKIKGE